MLGRRAWLRASARHRLLEVGEGAGGQRAAGAGRSPETTWTGMWRVGRLALERLEHGQAVDAGQVRCRGRWRRAGGSRARARPASPRRATSTLKPRARPSSADVAAKLGVGADDAAGPGRRAAASVAVVAAVVVGVGGDADGRRRRLAGARPAAAPAATAAAAGGVGAWRLPGRRAAGVAGR